jgi:hypothetical protein
VKCRRQAERYGERLDKAMHAEHGRGQLTGGALLKDALAAFITQATLCVYRSWRPWSRNSL